MAMNYGSLFSGPTADTVTDPRRIFHALPAKAKKYAYLRDVQGEVLGLWDQDRNRKDVVIKMNTGGGKTVVGLLALKSCLNEGFGPALYVAPDNYLSDQVRSEAKDLGIPVVTDPRSAAYQTGRAIAVINIHTLVNGRSRFGVGQEKTLEIGSVVVDDAHACLAIAEEQFTLQIPHEHPAYVKLLALFRDDLRSQSITGAVEIVAGDPMALVQVPFWAWIDQQAQVVAALSASKDDAELEYKWPLIKEDLAQCRCYFTAGKVEIVSRCLPIDTIPSFASAHRRIFMTATLADDSVLVSDFAASPDAVASPLTPSTAADIGERMIFVPQEINTDVKDSDIKSFIAGFKRRENVVVIVPSAQRADFWDDVVTPGLVLTAKNIQDGIRKLRNSKGNLAVLVNKYDGIDLPDDACRLLVIDGLPDARRLIDRYEQGAMKRSKRNVARQVQRIEQGMGRGVRSNEDYCAVVLMGARLLRTLFATGASRYFSAATARQMDLSREMTLQIANKGLESMHEPIQDLLSRNPGWVAAARNALINVVPPSDIIVDPIAVAQRASYDAVRRGRHELALQQLREAANSTSAPEVKGWVLDQAAAAIHPIDRIQSQKILASANDQNSLVTRPIAGIAYRRADTVGIDQAQRASDYLVGLYQTNANALILGINGLLGDLQFIKDNFEAFEQALADVGAHLGYVSQRPEKEGAGQLDVLWGIGHREYLLLPCKSEASSDTISKRYTDELSGNVNWFREQYDHTCKAIPTMVHPSDVLDAAASPPPGMRVISTAKLDGLRVAIREFGSAIKGRINEPTHVRWALSAHGLLGELFVARHTKAPRTRS